MDRGTRPSKCGIWKRPNWQVVSYIQFTIKLFVLIFSQLNSVRDSFGVVDSLKCKNGYLISLSSDMNSTLRMLVFCLTVRHMSSPQNISEGTCVMLNGYGCGLDFNDKYIIVQKLPPCSEDSKLSSFLT